MCDEEPTVPVKESCPGCPVCDSKRSKAAAETRILFDMNVQADKLFSAYTHNNRHIMIQIKKIKDAERIKSKFEMNLKANEEDMATLKASTIKAYRTLDAQVDVQSILKKLHLALIRITLPPDV